MTVDQFEALVQAQKPASTPWQPVTDNSYEARIKIEGDHPRLIKEVFQPSIVLDVGAGQGHLMRMLRACGVKAFGVDLHGANGVESGFDVSSRDISAWVGCRADLVICREVMEHLTILQIRQAVTNLCKLSSRFCYVTTRFTQNWTMPHAILSVDTKDDLDPTHQTMLNKDFLRVLFVLEGFRRRADLEERIDWQKKGRCLVYER